MEIRLAHASGQAPPSRCVTAAGRQVTTAMATTYAMNMSIVARAQLPVP
jgi:hypothetical protein